MGAPSHVRVRLCLLAALILGFAVDGKIARHAEASPAACVDPATYTRSVVSISRYFDKARYDGDTEIVGERATGWFYTSPRHVVTAAHFADDLPALGWQDVELHQKIREGEPEVAVRTQLRVLVKGTAPGLAEDVAILELREPFPNAQVLDVAWDRPPRDAAVVVLGYPGGRMQAARAIVREAGNPIGKYAGLTLIEVQGAERLLLNGGASGAPVLDCVGGRVIGVLNTLLTKTWPPFLSAEHSGTPAPTPTPWGSPTNTAVPVATLTAIRNCIP